MELWEVVARERVRDTIATYAHAGDRFRLDELVGCFVEDGVLEVKGRSSARGRAEILAMLSGAGRPAPADPVPAPASPSEPRKIVRHHVTNIRFDAVTPQRIEASAYFQVLNAHGLDHWGRYRDVFVPVAEQWLLAHRIAAVDAAVEGSWLNR